MVKASFLLARRPPLVCPTIASMASSRPCRGTLPRRSVLSVHVLVSVCFSSSSFLGFSCFTTASPVPSPSSQSFSPFGVPAPFAETSSWRPGFPSSYLCFLPSLPHSSGLRSPLFSSGHLAASSGGRCSAGRCTRARGTPGYSCLSSFSSANLVSLFPTSSVHSPSGPSARRRPAHRFAVTPVSSSFASLSRREPTAVGSARRQFLLFQGKSSDLKESYDTHKLRKRTHPGTIMIRSTLFRLLSAAKPAPTLVETTGKGPVALEIEQKVRNFSRSHLAPLHPPSSLCLEGRPCTRPSSCYHSELRLAERRHRPCLSIPRKHQYAS